MTVSGHGVIGALADDSRLCGRLRGAFGQVLAEAASDDALAGRPCPWTPPCAFEALFRKQGRMPPRHRLSQPLGAEAEGDALRVTLTVFGLAGEWMPTGPAEAMTAALPMCLLGALTHVGADVAFGCGRYRLSDRQVDP